MITAVLLALRRVPVWGYAIAALLAALAGLYGLEESRLALAHRATAKVTGQLATEQAARAKEKQAAAAAAAAATTAYRAVEQAYMLNNEAASAAREKDRESNQRVVADLRRQLAGVRGQLAAFATAGRPAAEDSLAACRDRASALGDVLAEALRVESELAADAEDRAADARALLEAWPRNAVTP